MNRRQLIDSLIAAWCEAHKVPFHHLSRNTQQNLRSVMATTLNPIFNNVAAQVSLTVIAEKAKQRVNQVAIIIDPNYRPDLPDGEDENVYRSKVARTKAEHIISFLSSEAS